jgi:hypothetical protein
MPHTLPIVETRNLHFFFFFNVFNEDIFKCKVLSPADYPYLLDYHPSFTTTLNAEVYPRTLGTNSLTGLPSNQVCRPFLSSSPYNDDKWTSHECDYYRTTLTVS